MAMTLAVGDVLIAYSSMISGPVMEEMEQAFHQAIRKRLAQFAGGETRRTLSDQ